MSLEHDTKDATEQDSGIEPDIHAKVVHTKAEVQRLPIRNIRSVTTE